MINSDPAARRHDEAFLSEAAINVMNWPHDQGWHGLNSYGDYLRRNLRDSPPAFDSVTLGEFAEVLHLQSKGEQSGSVRFLEGSLRDKLRIPWHPAGDPDIRKLTLEVLSVTIEGDVGRVILKQGVRQAVNGDIVEVNRSWALQFRRTRSGWFLMDAEFRENDSRRQGAAKWRFRESLQLLQTELTSHSRQPKARIPDSRGD